jgi:hypothetical protein
MSIPKPSIDEITKSYYTQDSNGDKWGFVAIDWVPGGAYAFTNGFVRVVFTEEESLTTTTYDVVIQQPPGQQIVDLKIPADYSYGVTIQIFDTENDEESDVSESEDLDVPDRPTRLDPPENVAGEIA